MESGFCPPTEEGELPAIRVHRGAEARKLRAQYANRIIPSRWHRQWKDMGDEFDNKPDDPKVPKHLGAKSRWIIQGFHDPDIALLNRTVPTPATADVPLALQMLASIEATAWVGDIKSAFTQSLRGLRTERIFASPPTEGIPGEEGDILIEILTEIYGMISGPPGWRQTLLTEFKNLEFRRHPLAPCVVLMYETLNGVSDQFSGLIVTERDGLLGGGIGDKFHEAVKRLKTRFTFERWVKLIDNAAEYGGRRVKQNADFSFSISTVRCL